MTVQRAATDVRSSADTLPVGILRCPVTHGRVAAMSEAQIAAANERIANGELRRRDGTPVQAQITSGFVSDCSRFGFAVDDGMAMLLESFAIVLRPEAPAGSFDETMSDEKGSVQAFYDEVGWTTTDEGDLVDTALFIDTRPVVQEYNATCRRRVQRHLQAGGNYLLDVASGPVQFPEYRAYSEPFRTRICVDLSRAALCGARRNLGDHGLYVVGDITNLPFADGTLDAVVSLHTIYHVPADEQATAFREIHRVLKPGRTAVVAYSWQTTPWRDRSLPMRILLVPGRLISRTRGLAGAVRPHGAASEKDVSLYYHAHDRGWFERQDWPFDHEIAVWSALSQGFLRKYIHPRCFGGQILAVVRRLEDRWPVVAGRIGRYPLIVIRKA